MFEFFLILLIIAAVGAVIATPILAFVAFFRTRRIDDLESRINYLERRIDKQGKRLDLLQKAQELLPKSRTSPVDSAKEEKSTEVKELAASTTEHKVPAETPVSAHPDAGKKSGASHPTKESQAAYDLTAKGLKPSQPIFPHHPVRSPFPVGTGGIEKKETPIEKVTGEKVTGEKVTGEKAREASKVTSKAEKRCPECELVLSDDAKSCPACGWQESTSSKPAETVPESKSKDIPEKDIPEKDIPEKDIPEKDIPETVGRKIGDANWVDGDIEQKEGVEGKQIESPLKKNRCPECKLLLDKEAASCPACGWQLESEASSPKSKADAEVDAAAKEPVTIDKQQPVETSPALDRPDLESEGLRDSSKSTKEQLEEGKQLQEQDRFRDQDQVQEEEQPRETVLSRLTGYLNSEELEAVVGTSWLNKIGVLVLVVGIALFIGYSFTRLGPAGRISIGYLISLGLLITGFIGERKEKYRIFARGLLGGGWAGIYFTTFATYGIEASRIISEPYLASGLLIAVATGMIVHSLFYQSQEVTTLAYFFAFLTIAISPISTYSSIASIPLIISLATIAYFWSWVRIALIGTVLTYGVWLLRFSYGVTEANIWQFHLVLFSYWLVFETLDLLLIKRNTSDIQQKAIYPLNTLGYLGITTLIWMQVKPDSIFWPLGASGIAYLVSALVRGRLKPPSEYQQKEDPFRVIFAGGYELSVTLSAILFAVASYNRFAGWQINFALIVEAEALFLTGLFLRQKYLQVLAGILILFELITLLFSIPESEVFTYAGIEYFEWIPIALLNVAIFYYRRLFVGKDPRSKGLGVEPIYAAVGTTLLLVVGYYQLPPQILAITALGYLLVLYELGYRLRLIEFRAQGYCFGAISIAWLLLRNGLFYGVPVGPVDQQSWWIWLLPAMCVMYGYTIRLELSKRQVLSKTETDAAYVSLLAVGTACYSLLIWHWLPVPMIAPGWATGGLILLKLGMRRPTPWARLNGNILVWMSVGWLFFANFTNFGSTFGISHRLLTVIPIIILLYHLAYEMMQSAVSSCLVKWEKSVPGFDLWLATALVVLLIRFELGRVLAVFGWALVLVVLLWIGVRRNVIDLRWQSYLIAILAFIRSWSTNFIMPASLAGLFGRLSTGVVVIGSFLVAEFLLPKLKRESSETSDRWIIRLLNRFDAHGRWIFCSLATALLAVLLSYELPEGMVAGGWGLQVLALLIIGFMINELPFLACGLALALVSVAKLLHVEFYGDPGNYRDFSYLAVSASFFTAYFLTPKLAMDDSAIPSGRLQNCVEFLKHYGKWLNSLLGSAVLASLWYFELSEGAVAGAWGLQVIALLIIGFLLNELPFLACGLLFALAAVASLFSVEVFGDFGNYRPFSYGTVSASFFLAYFLTRRLVIDDSAIPNDKFRRWSDFLKDYASWLNCFLGSAVLASLWYFELPEGAVAGAWGVQVLALLVIGFLRNELPFLANGLLFALAAVLNLFNVEVFGVFESYRLFSYGMVTASFFLAYFLTRRLVIDESAIPNDKFRRWSDLLKDYAGWLNCLLGTCVLASLLFFQLSGDTTTAAWGLQILLLLSIGYIRNELPFFVCGLGLAALAFLKILGDEVSDAPVDHRFFSYGSVIVSFFLAHFLTPKLPIDESNVPSEKIRKGIQVLKEKGTWVFCSIAALLVTILIAQEVSSRFLTVGWGIEGTALLITGFLIKDRAFRLLGLALLSLCVLKLFVYDLRGLDTPYRIGSFVLLGLLMIILSWVYTRYRDQIKKHI